MFIDREMELEQLQKRYASEQAELFVLYGRRRVGKTELLRTFCDGKPHSSHPVHGSGLFTFCSPGRVIQKRYPD